MKLLQPIWCANNSHSSTYFCHNIIRHIYCIPDPLIPPTRHNRGVQAWCITPQGCSLQTRRSILKRCPVLISHSYAPQIFPCPFINLQPSYLSMTVYSVFNVIYSTYLGIVTGVAACVTDIFQGKHVTISLPSATVVGGR